MTKNDRIEIKVSADVRDKFNLMSAELTPYLRRKLGRRVLGEDIINVIVEAYKKNPWAFTEQALSKPQFR